MLKKTVPILILLSFSLSVSGLAQVQSEFDSGFEWVSLSEAQERASESGKKILLFGYAEWCTFCLKMRKESFTDDRVQQSIEEYFIPVQLDGQSDEFVEYQGQKMKARELAKYLRLSSYPTHYFVDSDGTIMGAQPGFIEPDIYSYLLDYIGSGAMNEMKFDEYVESIEDGE